MKRACFILTAVSLLFVLGVILYESRQRSVFEARLAAGLAREKEMTTQLETLQSERDDSAARLASVSGGTVELRGAASDAQRLRGQLSRIARDLGAGGETIDPAERLKTLLAQVESLKRLPSRFPSLSIPEIALLTEDDWLDLARSAAAEQIETDEAAARRAFRQVRRQAKIAFGPRLTLALQRYLAASGGAFPSRVSDLKPYFTEPIEERLLERYEVFPAGGGPGLRREAEPVLLAEKAPVDTQFDTRLLLLGTNQIRVEDIFQTRYPWDPAANRFAGPPAR